jgi:hypothetical protein
MLKYLTNFFGKKQAAPVAPAPYKIETPEPAGKIEKAADIAPTAKKKAVKKASTVDAVKPTAKPKKPRAPKAPKA